MRQKKLYRKKYCARCGELKLIEGKKAKHCYKCKHDIEDERIVKMTITRRDNRIRSYYESALKTVGLNETEMH